MEKISWWAPISFGRHRIRFQQYQFNDIIWLILFDRQHFTDIIWPILFERYHLNERYYLTDIIWPISFGRHNIRFDRLHLSGLVIRQPSSYLDLHCSRGAWMPIVDSMWPFPSKDRSKVGLWTHLAQTNHMTICTCHVVPNHIKTSVTIVVRQLPLSQL